MRWRWGFTWHIPQIEYLEAGAYCLLGLIRPLRNLSRPVHRLPPEVFSQIIQRIPHRRASDMQSIIASTHVCRYWQNSIISTPQHWTLISGRSKGLTTSSLQRAKGAPLEIYVNIDDLREAPWFPKMIDLYVGNTKIIYFSNAVEIQGLKEAIPGFPQSMPNLRSLTVESDGVDGCPKRHTIDPFESLALPWDISNWLSSPSTPHSSASGLSRSWRSAPTSIST